MSTLSSLSFLQRLTVYHNRQLSQPVEYDCWNTGDGLLILRFKTKEMAEAKCWAHGMDSLSAVTEKSLKGMHKKNSLHKFAFKFLGIILKLTTSLDTLFLFYLPSFRSDTLLALLKLKTKENLFCFQINPFYHGTLFVLSIFFNLET